MRVKGDSVGGRGASSGISKSGKKYGTEYKSVFSVSNIKFVQHIGSSAVAPMETMTKGRVYVTVTDEEKPIYISYYDAKNKRSRTIDLSHSHKGIQPHVHHGYEHNEKDGKLGASKLTEKEKYMVDYVLNVWYNKK